MWEHAWITLMGEKIIVVHYVLIAATQIEVALQTLNELLKRKRSMKWIRLWYLMKILVLDVLFNILLNDYMPHHLGLYSFFICFKATVYIMNLIVIWLIFEGDFIKCALCGITAEALAISIGAVSMILSGIMDNKLQNVNLSVSTLRILQFILICFILFYIIRFLIRHFWRGDFPLLDKYQIKHRKFWGTVFFIYIGSLFGKMVVEEQTKLAGSYQIMIIIGGTAAVGFGILAAWIYRKYQNQIRQEHEFLNIKQNLMVLHMKAVRQQILDMENEQRIIDQQMENIRQIGHFEGTVQIEKYLRTLKNQYRKIQAGMYTDDVFVDSILYYYADMMRRKNQTMEISFARYQRNSLNEMCAGKILMCLMETALTNNPEEKQEHKVKLYGGTVKNQAIFRLECGISERTKNKRFLPIQCRIEDHNKKALKVLKKCVKQYNGKCRVIRGRNRMELEIILTGNGENGQDK